MFRFSLPIVVFTCLASTTAVAQQPQLRRVIELPAPYGTEGAFLVVGRVERPPAGPVVVVRNDHHISNETESPGITQARHFDVVFGPTTGGTIPGVLLPCRPDSVRLRRVVWIRDHLHGDHQWRRAVEATQKGDCRPVSLPIGPAFLTSANMSGVIVAPPSSDEGVARFVANALGVTQVVVYADIGVGAFVVRYGENNRWRFARVALDGSVVRYNDQHGVMGARVGFGGPVAICTGGDSFLIDRRSGPGDPEYQLLHVGRCGRAFSDS